MFGDMGRGWESLEEVRKDWARLGETGRYLVRLDDSG